MGRGDTEDYLILSAALRREPDIEPTYVCPDCGEEYPMPADLGDAYCPSPECNRRLRVKPWPRYFVDQIEDVKALKFRLYNLEALMDYTHPPLPGWGEEDTKNVLFAIEQIESILNDPLYRILVSGKKSLNSWDEVEREQAVLLLESENSDRRAQVASTLEIIDHLRQRIDTEGEQHVIASEQKLLNESIAKITAQVDAVEQKLNEIL